MNWKIWKAPIDDESAPLVRTRELETRRSRQSHEIALAGLDDERTSVRQERKELRADRRESHRLAKLSRQVRVSGARVSAAHNLINSGEYRALRVQKIRRYSLLALMPVLIAFASWSTLGVHAGVVGLLGNPGGSLDLGAWFVEPALATIVAGIIVVRAALRSSGGDLDWRATAVEWSALTVSVILNLAGAWPDSGRSAAVAATVAHSIGPVGLMATAFLISIIDDAVANAKPFEGRPRMADPMVLLESVPLSRPTVPEQRDNVVGQVERDSDVGQPERPTLSRPKAPRLSQPKVSQKENGTALVPVSQPKVSQFDKIVESFEQERDAGRPASVRAIAELTGASKTTVGRVLKTYLDEVQS
jgi:hypothetical protein